MKLYKAKDDLKSKARYRIEIDDGYHKMMASIYDFWADGEYSFGLSAQYSGNYDLVSTFKNKKHLKKYFERNHPEELELTLYRLKSAKNASINYPSLVLDGINNFCGCRSLGQVMNNFKLAHYNDLRSDYISDNFIAVETFEDLSELRKYIRKNYPEDLI